MKPPLEGIYREHHAKRRGEGFLTNGEVRGQFLQKTVGIGKKVLDIGCRDGALTAYYAKDNMVTGIDIDSVALEKAGRDLGIETVHADLNGDWPIEGPFDAIVACEILEHLYYPDQVLRKIYDRLKPGGLLVGSIPHAFSLQGRARLMFANKKGTALQDPTHINHFWGGEFEKLVKDAGFEDVALTGIFSKKFRPFSKVFPYALAHSFVFSARKPLGR
jgi:2-polyprenyl-3-methyl-5-hydroxy-6-metoxy-1,4-benzoquinol methylase